MNVVIDIYQPFVGVFPRDFAPWGRDQLFKGWEVEIVQELIPESDGLVNRCSRISLGRSVVDMDAMELMKVSCCCDMNEDMSLEPRRLVKAFVADCIASNLRGRRELGPTHVCK